MHDLDYELQDELHSCSIETIMYGVNVFDEDYGQEAAAAFVVAAELPLVVDADGFWSINEQDERVKDFPPE